MAANAISRQVIREEIASRATTALTAGAGPFQTIYSDNRRTWKGESPVLVILSEGTAREPLGMGNIQYWNRMRFSFLIFVLEADEKDANWTEANVEDKVDECEKEVSDFIMDNRQAVGFWLNLLPDGDFSAILPATVGGESYRMEILTVIAEVPDA